MTIYHNNKTSAQLSNMEFRIYKQVWETQRETKSNGDKNKPKKWEKLMSRGSFLNK